VRGARALSVASVALALSGCAMQRVEVEPVAPRGAVVARPGRPGFVIAVSHATADPQSRDVAAELARRTGFGLVIADGGRIYEQGVREAAQGPLAFYAEIHGAPRSESASRIEIATVGGDAAHAGRLRTLFELIRDAHLRGSPGAPRVDVLVAPADARDRLLLVPGRTIQVAVPRIARGEAREPYLTILADFLAQAAALPVGR